MSLARILKDPGAVLPYGFDWSYWLGSDTIVTSTWTVPVGITQDSETETTTTTTIWLSGGTAGDEYDIVNRIVTAAGAQDDRTMTIVMENR